MEGGGGGGGGGRGRMKVCVSGVFATEPMSLRTGASLFFLIRGILKVHVLFILFYLVVLAVAITYDYI